MGGHQALARSRQCHEMGVSKVPWALQKSLCAHTREDACEEESGVLPSAVPPTASEASVTGCHKRLWRTGHRKTLLCLHAAGCFFPVTYPCGSLTRDWPANRSLSCTGLSLPPFAETDSVPPRPFYSSGNASQIQMPNYSHTGLARPEASCHIMARPDSAPHLANSPREDTEVHVPFFWPLLCTEHVHLGLAPLILQ